MLERSSKQVRVLIAEDSPAQAEILRQGLETEGYGLDIVHDGQAALDYIRSQKPDVVLLDIVMPGLSGIEVCRVIKEDEGLGFLPVVLVTALDSAEAKLSGIEAGADDFLNKPTDMNELKARVRSLVRAKNFFDNVEKRYTELQMANKVVARKNAELEALNKQKNHFLGMAAHDLRNPLNAIMTYSQFLHEEVGQVLSPEQNDFLDSIHKSSEFMLRLVTDLLEFSQIQTGNMTLNLGMVDLTGLIDRIVGLSRLLSDRKGIGLKVEKDHTLPKMYLDEHKIEQVLTNLLTNAIKYSHANTTVEIGVSQRDDVVTLWVKDQGQGIPTEELDNLFEPFKKTSVKSTGGEASTGLGLVIVKQIVNGHGGEISVESEVGTGSLFTVTLPIQEGKAQTQEPLEMPDLRPLTLLVVEDNLVNQRLVQRFLEKQNHGVVVVSNGEDALQSVRKWEFDAVLMDLEMPQMGGVQATELMRAEGVSIPIIGLTGHGSEVAHQKALAAGMQACLSKPLDPYQLFCTLNELISK